MVNTSSTVDSVALRKESVDRNCLGGLGARPPGVALRKESVDRNRIIAKEYDWDALVALRKESVDRNLPTKGRRLENRRVALRKESVDRNIVVLVPELLPWCRSPQGERG